MYLHIQLAHLWVGGHEVPGFTSLQGKDDIKSMICTAHKVPRQQGTDTSLHSFVQVKEGLAVDQDTFVM